jgi:hypothetical protein
LRKVAPRKEVPFFVTSGVCTDFIILSWVTGILQSPTNYYNGSKDPNMSKQFTAGYKKHIILTNPEKLDIIKRLESHARKRDVTVPHNNGSSTIYDIKKWND